MEPQTLINGAGSLILVLCGFVIRALWDAVSSLRVDLAALQKFVTDTYVRRDDFKDHALRVESLLDKIYEKLDAKVDRHEVR